MVVIATFALVVADDVSLNALSTFIGAFILRIGVQELQARETVGYGTSFVVERAKRIGVVA